MTEKSKTTSLMAKAQAAMTRLLEPAAVPAAGAPAAAALVVQPPAKARAQWARQRREEEEQAGRAADEPQSPSGPAGEALAPADSGTVMLAQASGSGAGAAPAVAATTAAPASIGAGGGAAPAAGSAAGAAVADGMGWALGAGLLVLGASAGGGGGDKADTTPPALLSMTAGNRVVTLTFDSTLDGVNKPATADFVVTVNGVPNTVTGVSVRGAVLELTTQNPLTSGALISVTYTDAAGNSANAIQDQAGNDAASFVTGKLADGYVRGAKVYIDTNGNNRADDGVDYLVGLTDQDGNFFIPSTAPSGTIIAVGGVNIDTGLPNTVALKAPAGSTTVNPLTTLVQAVIQASPGAAAAPTSAQIAQAAQTVAQALGLTLPAGQTLTSFDPISAAKSSSDPIAAENAFEAQKAAAQVATIVALASSGSNPGTDASATVVSNLAGLILNSSTVDLADNGTLGSVFAGANLSAATREEISNATAAIAAVSADDGLEAISSVQTQIAQSAQFGLVESGETVSFLGDAAGPVNVSFANGAAVFSRAGTQASATVTGLAGKTVAGDVDLVIDVTGAATAEADTFTINAPQATSITLKGGLAAGADEFVIKVTDPAAGTFNERTLHFNSSELEASGDTLTFQFAESARNVLSNPNDNDWVTLTPSSHISSAFSTLKVIAGFVNTSQISAQAGGSFPEGKEWIVGSGVVFSLQQLQTTQSIISLTDSGGLIVSITAAQRGDLETFLASPGALKLVGVTTAVRVDGVMQDLDLPANATIKAGVDAISFPAFVKIKAALDELAGSGYDAANYQSIVEISQALDVLNGTGVGSVAKVAADLVAARSEVDTALGQTLATLKGDAAAGYDTLGELEDAIQAVNALVATINTNKVAAFDTLGEVATAITALQGALTTLNANDSTGGSVASAVKTAFDTLTTNYATAIGAAVSGLKGSATGAGDTLGELESLITSLKGVVDTMTLGASASFDTLKEIGDAITAINTTITGLGGTYATDAELASAQTALTTAYTTAISTAVAGLTGGATGAGDTLGELESLITSLKGVVDTIKAGASPSFDTLKEIGDAITAINTSFASLGGNYATDAELTTAVNDLTTAYGTAIGTAVSGLTGTATGAGDTLGELEALLTTLTGVVNTIKAGASTSFDTLKEIGDEIAAINTTIAGLGGTYATDAELTTAVNNLTTAYGTAITTAVAGLKGTATEAGDTLGELQTLIAGLTTLVGTINTNKVDAYDTLGEVATAIATINTTIADLGGTYATDAELTTAVNNLTTAYGTAITTAVAGLKGSATNAGDTLAELEALIASLTTVVGTINTGKVDAFDTLGEVATAITTLQTAVASLTTTTGSGGAVDARLTALETKLTGISSTVVNAIKTVSLTPTLSVVGSDLNDSVLETAEGNLTVRVSLPTAAAANDVVELFLDGAPFGTAKTDTLNSTEVGNTYVDFTVTSADLGAAGAKALTAKITSGGTVTSNASAGIFFTLSAADVTAPNAPVLDPVASNNLISKVEHDGTTWLTGTAEADAKVTIHFLDENNSNTVVSERHVDADAYGNWYLPYSSNSLPVDGTYTIRVKATDAAGLVSGNADRTGVVIDSAAPTAAPINAVATDDIVDAIENGAGFTISGTGETGATVTLVLSSGRTLTGGNTATVVNGQWSFAVAANEAGQYFKLGDELITVYQTDAVGNVSPESKRLIDVITTVVAGGNLSAQSYAGVSKLELNANSTLPTVEANLPLTLDAKGYDITVADSMSLANMTITNVKNLTVADGETVTLTASQASAFNTAGSITLGAGSAVAATAGGNLAVFDLENVSLTLNGATTLPTATARLPKALDANAFAVTVSESVDLTAVTLTDPGSFAVAAGKTLTVTPAQANAIAGVMSTPLSATLPAGPLSDFSTLEETGNAYTVTVNDASTATLLATELSSLGGKTTGTVTVTNAVTISGTAAEATAALVTPDTLVVAGTAKVTITDSISVGDVNAIAAKTSGVVTATLDTGALASFNTLAETGNAYTVTVTDTISVDDANTVSAKTSGVVTATLAAGNLASFAGLAETGNAYIVAISDAATETLQASTLSTLGGRTTSQVTVQNAVTVSGTVSQLTAALVTAETQVTAATANVVASDSGSVAADSLVAIDGVTSGLITAANVGTLTGNAAAVRGVTDNLATSGSNKFSIGAMVGSVTNAAVTLSGTATLVDLRAIDQSASGMITAADVTSLSGTVTDVRAVLDNLGTGSNKFSLGTMTDNVTNVGLTLTDTTMTAANVLLLDTATTGVVTIAAGSTVTGTQTEINNLFGATGVSRPGDLSVTVTGVLLSGTELPGYLDFIGANTNGTIGVEGSVDANPLNFSATGRRLVIDGGAGNDTITGTGYGDRLIGGAGNDGITMGAGADVLVFNSLSGSDTVAGFNVAADQIELAKAVMTGLGNVNGALTDAQFESGAGLTAAVDTTTRIFYNETTGALYYDADGSAAGAAVQLATFTSAPLLTYQDFLIA